MQQLIVITSLSWESTEGTLSYFEKRAGIWYLVAESILVSLGRSGMGWGKGVPFPLLEGPQKREGDGRSPAGLFSIKLGFSQELILAKLPLLIIDQEMEWIDDSSSQFYNQCVTASQVVKDWNSSEKMYLEKLYRRGIVIEHNREPALPELGSAIFFHEWRSIKAPTAGCTALSKEDLERLFHWLDIQKKPTLIQLPKQIFSSDVVVRHLQEEKLPLDLLSR